MTRETVSRVENNEGTVVLYKAFYDDNTIGYEVIKSTSSLSTSKSIHLKNFEKACKRYNKYTTELAQEYMKKFL